MSQVVLSQTSNEHQIVICIRQHAPRCGLNDGSKDGSNDGSNERSNDGSNERSNDGSIDGSNGRSNERSNGGQYIVDYWHILAFEDLQSND